MENGREELKKWLETVAAMISVISVQAFVFTSGYLNEFLIPDLPDVMTATRFFAKTLLSSILNASVAIQIVSVFSILFASLAYTFRSRGKLCCGINIGRWISIISIVLLTIIIMGNPLIRLVFLSCLLFALSIWIIRTPKATDKGTMWVNFLNKIYLAVGIAIVAVVFCYYSGQQQAHDNILDVAKHMPRANMSDDTEAEIGHLIWTESSALYWLICKPFESRVMGVSRNASKVFFNRTLESDQRKRLCRQ